MSLNSAVIVYERQAGMAEVLLTQRRDPLRPLLVDLRRLINWLNTFRFHVARRLSLPVDIQIFDAPNFVRLIDGRVIVIPPEGE